MTFAQQWEPLSAQERQGAALVVQVSQLLTPLEATRLILSQLRDAGLLHREMPSDQVCVCVYVCVCACVCAPPLSPVRA